MRSCRTKTHELFDHGKVGKRTSKHPLLMSRLLQTSESCMGEGEGTSSSWAATEGGAQKEV